MVSVESQFEWTLSYMKFFVVLLEQIIISNYHVCIFNGSERCHPLVVNYPSPNADFQQESEMFSKEAQALI